MKVLAVLSLLAFSGCMHKHWKKMDVDKDNKVSKKEFDDMHAKMFKKMDKNSDGYITKDERKH